MIRQRCSTQGNRNSWSNVKGSAWPDERALVRLDLRLNMSELQTMVIFTGE